ncbi:PPR1C phosphatase, partial [Rhagologus leucostigma]|nr:PPR1C phosphatase [Rhagologus leucostigma]
MEPNSPKKIQFAVPLFQSQIDPEAAEQVRMTSFLHCFEGRGKRRPTPASLVIMNEHMPPGAVGYPLSSKDTKLSLCPSLTASLCFVPPQSQSASPKQRKQSVFTPPALKG